MSLEKFPVTLLQFYVEKEFTYNGIHFKAKTVYLNFCYLMKQMKTFYINCNISMCYHILMWYAVYIVMCKCLIKGCCHRQVREHCVERVNKI